MRKFAVFLIVSSIFLVFVRIFTGITYSRDSETGYFVIKKVPSFEVERSESAERPYSQDILLFGDEFGPPFGDEYVTLMDTVPILPGGLSIISLLILYFCRRKNSS